MNMPPSSLSRSRKPGRLTDVITVFGLIFGMAFGICSVSGISLSRGGNVHTAHLLIQTALITGAICVACLVGVAVFVRIRSHRAKLH
jgi:cation transporter-like permease